MFKYATTPGTPKYVNRASFLQLVGYEPYYKYISLLCEIKKKKEGQNTKYTLQVNGCPLLGK